MSFLFQTTKTRQMKSNEFFHGSYRSCGRINKLIFEETHFLANVVVNTFDDVRHWFSFHTETKTYDAIVSTVKARWEPPQVTILKWFSFHTSFFVKTKTIRNHHLDLFFLTGDKYG